MYPHCYFLWLQCFHCHWKEHLISKVEKPKVERFLVWFSMWLHSSGATGQVLVQPVEPATGVTWCAVWEPGSVTETCATTETTVGVALLAIAQGLFLSSVKNCVTLVLARYPSFSTPPSTWSASGDRLSARTEPRGATH